MYTKQHHSHDDSDSNYDEEETRRNGLNQAEQMHILASVNINPSEDDIKFSKDDFKRYSKEGKGYFKNKS